MSEQVYLSLGSNLGDRRATLRAAIRALGELGGVRVIAASRLYETEPWEQEPGTPASERPWYLNCAVEIETELSATDLLAALQRIEQALGRTRPTGTPEALRFAPRTLDIDILFYGRRVVSTRDDLHIPHLLLHERAFVLRPLADLAPGFEHPTLYRTIQDLLAEVADEHEIRPADAPARWFEP